MIDSASQAYQERAPRPLDEAFARWAAANFPDEEAEKSRLVSRLARAVSYSLHLKHSCLDLNRYKDLNDPVLNALLDGINPQVLAALQSNTISVNRRHNLPLVRNAQGTHVWLHKYFAFEQDIAAGVRERAVKVRDLSVSEKEILDKRFQGDQSLEQKKAVEIALTHRLAIITGGPGTGKTWTVARIIEILLNQDQGGRWPVIELAAPTGKAANRMKESLDSQISDLGLPPEQLPEKARTLHSLLGIHYRSPRPAFHAGKPLRLDVLIVDEASMIDLPMMQRILDALPEQARLILLGDRDQLSSVEAGSVLAELCDGKSGLFDPQSSPIATISYSHRFGGGSEIGLLADAINTVSELPDFSANAQVLWRESSVENVWDPGWKDEAVARFKALRSRIIDAVPAADILARQADFQILCALRKGPAGVSGINAIISRELKEVPGKWYPGLPVMVRINDHERKLYNGDTGLVMRVSKVDGEWVIDSEKGVLRACFLTGGGQVKAISLAQMPAFETCYALTIHKSQGSEYNKVMLVLPADKEEAEQNPVLTRELLYTGVTRASEAVEIWSGKGVLESTVQKKTTRMSGLSQHSSHSG